MTDGGQEPPKDQVCAGSRQIETGTRRGAARSGREQALGAQLRGEITGSRLQRRNALGVRDLPVLVRVRTTTVFCCHPPNAGNAPVCRRPARPMGG